MRRRAIVAALIGAHGPLLLALGASMLLPLVLGLALGEPGTLAAFGLPALLCLALGGLCRRFFPTVTLDGPRAMLLCGLAWIGLSLLGALPYVLLLGTPPIDALFEAVSGFTTTGITMLAGLDGMPASILLWRALTQWIGGLGIITLFLAVLQRGAHHLVGAEAHKIATPRPVPGLVRTLRALLGIYAGLTAAVAVALLLCGASFFDALCHALTTLSTGGFSTHDASIAWFAQQGFGAAIEWVLVVGMCCGGMSFVVHFRLLRGQGRALWDGREVRLWWMLLAGFTLLILAERGAAGAWTDLERELRTALFQVLAVLTTTGFGTVDIGTPWFGTGARLLFLAMMLIGGCVGSTGGGFKVLRIALLGALLRQQLARLVLPRRARRGVVLDGKLVGAEELARVAALFFGWLALLFLGGLLTALLSDHGMSASMSGMCSALGNIGPCYIPLAELPLLHPLIKLTYIFGMLAGRLEILPLLILFSPRAWTR